MMQNHIDFVRKLRPAPVGSAVSWMFGLNKRRLVQTPHGKFLLSPVSNLGYQLAHGEYEPAMTRVLHRYLKPGDVFIDLGANEGYFTIIASSLVGDSGSVIAIEPQSRLQHSLKATLALNDCANVQLFQTLVTSSTGTARLHLAADTNTGATSLFRVSKYPVPTEEVRSMTLRDFLRSTGIKSCDLLKVDIEGAEYEVFMSAGEVLKSGAIRKIALEIHGSILEGRGLSGEELHRFILSHGYILEDEAETRVYAFAGADSTSK